MARNRCDELVTVLVGNKKDKERDGEREVTMERGLAFAEQYGMDMIEASAKDGTDTEEILRRVGSKLLRLAKPSFYTCTSLGEIAKLQSEGKCSCS